MLERTDDIKNEVLEPITFVLAYPNVQQITSVLLLKYSIQYLRLCAQGGYYIHIL